MGVVYFTKTVYLNEYISMQDGIIVIIVLNFYDLLNLFLSEDSCKKREIGADRYGRVTGRASANKFFRIKNVV